MEAAGYHSYNVKSVTEKKKRKTREILNDNAKTLGNYPNRELGTYQAPSYSNCPANISGSGSESLFRPSIHQFYRACKMLISIGQSLLLMRVSH